MSDLFTNQSGNEAQNADKKLMDRREGEISKGKLPGVYYEKVTFDQLAEGFLRDYRINQRKSIKRAERSADVLNEFFEGYRVPDITTPKVNEYIEIRMQEEATNATINRELSALKRMLSLGIKQTPPLVERMPYIPRLKENNVRKGFFEHGEFVAIRKELPEYLKGFVTFAYTVGWRSSEITNLTWKNVDLNQGIVRLEAGETKNDDARTVFLDDGLKEVFQKQWRRRKDQNTLSPYVFPNYSGNGKIKDFRSAWFSACKTAGIGRRLFHDFRRTAIRNMVRSGTPERVAMMISGHKTRSVFDRYNIVNDADLKAASKRQADYLANFTGTISGTIADFPQKKGVRDDG
jgi:integrase